MRAAMHSSIFVTTVTAKDKAWFGDESIIDGCVQLKKVSLWRICAFTDMDCMRATNVFVRDDD